MVDWRAGCGQICAGAQIFAHHFDFGGYAARFIHICSFFDLLCHAGEPHGRSMVFAIFRSFRVLRGLSSSCSVLLSLPRFLLLPRKLRRRTTTPTRLPSRTQLRNLGNTVRNRLTIPGLRVPLPSVIARRTIRPRRVPAKETMRSAGVAPAGKRRRIVDAVVTTSPRGNGRARISSTMRLSHPLNCGPWRSS